MASVDSLFPRFGVPSSFRGLLPLQRDHDFRGDSARYASIGGKPSPQQPELIRAAAAQMPVDSEIVSAMDADADGAKLTDVVRKAVAMTGRLDLRFAVQEPCGFKDWNDVLRAKPQTFFSYRPDVPFVT